MVSRGSLARSSAIWLWMRWSAITRFMKPKQRMASVSLTRKSEPFRQLALDECRHFDGIVGFVAQMLWERVRLAVIRFPATPRTR